MRKIIQICESTLLSSSMGDCFNISALCDDGTLWYLNEINKGWFKYPDIPQDKVSCLTSQQLLKPIYSEAEVKELKYVYRIEPPSPYGGYQVLKVVARNVSSQKYKFGGYYKTREEAEKAIELITGMDFKDYSEIKYNWRGL